MNKHKAARLHLLPMLSRYRRMSESVQHDEQCLSLHDRWCFRYDEQCSSLHTEGLICCTTHENLVLHGLKSVIPQWGLAVERLDHLHNFKSPHFSKILNINNFLNHFYRQLKLWMHHMSLTCYKQENLSYKADFEAFFPDQSNLCLLSSKDGSQRHRVSPTGRYSHL